MEYGYKNSDDSKRFKVFRVMEHEGSGGDWDVDIWNGPEDVQTFSSEAADRFRTKKDAIDWIKSTYGPIRLLPAGWTSIREGWIGYKEMNTLEALKTAVNVNQKTERLVVYGYKPMGALKQRRFALAKGDRPEDVISTHGTHETAVKAGKKLSEKLGVPLKVEF
jgi:hypothetical protein